MRRIGEWDGISGTVPKRRRGPFAVISTDDSPPERRPLKDFAPREGPQEKTEIAVPHGGGQTIFNRQARDDKIVGESTVEIFAAPDLVGDELNHRVAFPPLN